MAFDVKPGKVKSVPLIIHTDVICNNSITHLFPTINLLANTQSIKYTVY